MKNTDRNDSSVEKLLTEANRCVACGLCLPHCPTYHLTHSEADSPRGRIALMSGVASGRIPLNERFIQHMDRCLTCRACEQVCPNNVAYGQLIDGARVMIHEYSSVQKESQYEKGRLRDFLEREFIAKPGRFDRLRPVLRLLAGSGLLSLLLRLEVLRRSDLIQSLLFLATRNLPGQLWRRSYPARGVLRGEVGLFLGCVARLIDTETLLSSIFVLNRLGYTVRVPDTQTCCGALHQHSGRIDAARSLAQQNLHAFEGLNIQAIINTASGCGVQLTEYSSRLDTGFSVPVMDISQFLDEQEWDEVGFAPLSRRVAVHEPCTLRNTLRTSKHMYPLLRRIPGIEVVELPGNEQCCGAAGTYFLDQPEFAKSLLDAKLQAFESTGADCLVTGNIGCALHIANGLAKKGTNIEVLHPVTLLARQMRIK
ncbi:MULTISPECIES: (Fe-S)-binding protein [Nitrosomonas]|uniref:(Fe-S)-binding protein n=1 Tax=Nitrosomonas TaxID=914 RepID=UPI0019390DE8|nr:MULTISPECIES: (Fe-S)-binding protein [Nitrosomonas]QOJ08363.1 MAG: (Fe-S)-binding protein [Nitrosomonas sp. H1_AOB3]HRN80854.1 (Fe-S)-binding protein [Nitrosomonas europaea]